MTLELNMNNTQPETVLWFEFLLDPTLLERHLNKPNPDPSPTDLITLFMGFDPKQENSITDLDKIESMPAANNKRELTVKILTMKVMAFMKWDLDAMEPKLTSRVIMLLLEDLLFITLEDEYEAHESFRFEEMDHQSIFAVLLWHRWILKAVMYNSLSWKHPRLVYIPTPGGPDSNVIAAKKRDELRLLLEGKCVESVRVLKNILDTVKQVVVPTVESFIQPTETSGETSAKWESGVTVNEHELKCQVNFELAEFFMFRQEYNDAREHLGQCLQFIQGVQSNPRDRSSVNFCKVEEEVVVAMATACEVPKCPVLNPTNLVDKLKASVQNQYTGIIQILQTDNLLRVIPIPERDIVEVEIQMAMRSGTFTVAKDLLSKMQILNGIRRVMAACSPAVDVLQVLKNSGNRGIDFFLTCIQSVFFDVSKDERENLVRFLLDLMLKDESSSNGGKTLVKTVLLSDEAIRNHFTTADIDCLNKLSSSSCPVNDIPKLQDVSLTLISRCPRLEIMNIQQQLIQSYDTATVKCLLHKLSTKDSRKSWFTINAKWDVPIPLQSLIMSLPKGVTQDVVFILLAKSRELCQTQNFEMAISLLETAKKEAKEASGVGAAAAFKLNRLLEWEILLIQINQYINVYPKNVSDLEQLVLSCKSCLEASSARDSIVPRLEVLESCALALLNLGEWETLISMEKRWIYLELAAAFAAACQDIVKYKGSKKISRAAWDLVLPVFGPSPLKRSNTGSTASPTGSSLTKSSLVRFLTQLRDPTVLCAATSLLARLHNVLRDEASQEINCVYVALWPAVVSNSNSYNAKLAAEILSQIAIEALKFSPNPFPLLKILGEINFVVGDWACSLRCYLETGALASDYFTKIVPKTALDDFTYKRMIKCCSQLHCYTQAAVLCQCLDDVDYSTAFKCFSETKSLNCSDAMDAYYSCIWDITLLEFLVNMHGKRGEIQRKQQVVKILGLLELNSNNNEEIQREAANVRRSKLLRALTRQFSISGASTSLDPKSLPPLQ